MSEYAWGPSRIRNKEGELGEYCRRLLWPVSSKYTPHQGAKECARRVKQHENIR